MRKAILYIHGKHGNKEEANRYKKLCNGFEVIGLDYCGNTPWKTKDEIMKEYQRITLIYDEVYIIGNSIGAYFAMNAFSKAKISKAFFISPIVDMEKLILDMMKIENITEKDLKEKRIIPTRFGEDLSYEYLAYVRKNPIDWKVKTSIIYGRKDNLTSYETISNFSKINNCKLTVIEDGEHYFHTKEQLELLDKWLLNELE